MRTMPTLPNRRNRELGAIAIIIAFAWTALFGMAVLAIDFGYLYAKRRGVQAVADAALRASMPTWVDAYPSGLSAATAKANLVASANGYVNGGGTAITTTQDVGNNLYTVSVSRMYPTFIGGVFGLSGKTVTGKATGRRNASSAGAAIHANNAAACPGSQTWGLGLHIEGTNPILTINGNVESNTQVYFGTGVGSTITGTVKSPCTPLGATFNPASATITGGDNGIGAPYADPINVTVDSLNAFCSFGTSVNTPMLFGTLIWTNTGGPGGCDTPNEGVFCSNSDITVAPEGSMSICPGSRATFITRGRVQVGANTAIRLQPATGAPNNLIIAAYSNAGLASCTGGPDLNLGSAGTFNLTGNVYVPNGCIQVGGGDIGGFTMTGSLVAKNISMNPSPLTNWTFAGAGGGGGGGWTVYQ